MACTFPRRAAAPWTPRARGDSSSFFQEAIMPTQVQNGILAVLIGGGAPEPVSLEEASQLTGRITDVLLRHYVRDDALVAELSKPGAVVEQRVRRADGSVVETSLTGREDWRSVVRRVEEGETVTLGLAVRHVGGNR